MLSKVRDDIVRWAKWGVAHETFIHYSQSRPIPIHTHPGTLPLRTDCSGFATLTYAWSGAPDPNGLHYSGQGYTGTLLKHMRHVRPVDTLPGDLVVFGPYPGHHVVILVESARIFDPLCVSHGQERGPMLVRLSQEQRYQPWPKTFLSCLPAHDPTPAHHAPAKLTDPVGGSVRRTL